MKAFSIAGAGLSVAGALLFASPLSAASAAAAREVKCGQLKVRSATYVVHAVGVPCPFARGWVPQLAVQKAKPGPTGTTLKGPAGYKCAANAFYGTYGLASIDASVKKLRASGLTQNDGNCGSTARSIVKFSWEIQFAP